MVCFSLSTEMTITSVFVQSWNFKCLIIHLIALAHNANIFNCYFR